MYCLVWSSGRLPVLLWGLLSRRLTFGTPVFSKLSRLVVVAAAIAGGGGGGRGIDICVDCVDKTSEIAFVRAL